jgi:SAM-dependent methyltransferase
MLKEAGFIPHGIEISKKAADKAIAAGHSVSCLDAHDFVWDGDKFDAAFALHSLEHCYDPAKVAANIHKSMRRGGLFYVEIPKQRIRKAPTGAGHMWFNHKGVELLAVVNGLFEVVWYQPMRMLCMKKEAHELGAQP